MAGKLEGRRVVITGCSRGVGLATAHLFLREGAEVLGLARDASRLEKATADLEASGPGRFTSIVTDLTAQGAEVAVRNAVAERWDGLDILVNNAAVMLGKEARGLIDEPMGVLEATMEANFFAPYRLTRSLIPLLEKGREPRVLLVSSGAGCFALVADSGIGSYRVSKWALNGMTLQLAQELKGKIAVNAFDPGWVRTDLGGPNAPGTPEESARGALAATLLPFETVGKLWKDGEEVAF